MEKSFLHEHIRALLICGAVNACTEAGRNHSDDSNKDGHNRWVDYKKIKYGYAKLAEWNNDSCVNNRKNQGNLINSK